MRWLLGVVVGCRRWEDGGSHGEEDLSDEVRWM